LLVSDDRRMLETVQVTRTVAVATFRADSGH
jgi:hypothetical protein